jgi:dTDP-4-amino-4,6-dideoxygalactose transaminase
MPALSPNDCPVSRAAVIAALNEEGISAGHYFSPHLAEQPYFAATCVIADLDVTQRIAARVLSLPMSDLMNGTEVMVVCEALRPDELGGHGLHERN